MLSKYILLVKKIQIRPLGKLAQNTIFSTLWQVIRLSLQMFYLVLVARLLGVDGYGTFAGIVALASSLSPLAGSGFSLILVKQVSRRAEMFPIYWARTLAAIAFCALPLVGCVFLISLFMLPPNINHLVIILVACTELFFVPMIAACSNVYQAHEQLGKSIFNFVILNAFRLAAVINLQLYSGKMTLDLFALIYFGATALSVICSLIKIRQQFGKPIWNLRGMLKEIKEGLGFSISGVASIAHSEIDKTILLRIGSAASAGSYSMASRVISAVSVPLVSYTLASVPKLFRHGEHGVSSGTKLAWQLLPPVLIYGLLSGLAIFVLAPFIPLLLGTEFSTVVTIIQWLSALPLLIGVSTLFLGVLSCSGAQRTRVLIEGISLAVNVILNIVLIPSLGITGVVISALISQLTLTSIVAIMVIRISTAL